MDDWKTEHTWVAIAGAAVLSALIGWGLYEAASNDNAPVRVLSTQGAPAQAVTTVAPGAGTATPVVVVQPQQHDSSFFENWAMWHMITGGNNTSHTTTREVHHVYHQPAPAQVSAPAPQHHGFVSTPAPAKAAPVIAPKPAAAARPYTPVSRPVSAIRVSSPSPSRSYSSPSRSSSSGRR